MLCYFKPLPAIKSCTLISLGRVRSGSMHYLMHLVRAINTFKIKVFFLLFEKKKKEKTIALNDPPICLVKNVSTS